MGRRFNTDFQGMREKAITNGTFFIGMAIVLAGELIIAAVTYHTAWPAISILGVERLLVGILLLILFAGSKHGFSSIGVSHGRSMAHGVKRGLLWSACSGLAAMFLFAALFVMKISPLALIRTPLPADFGPLLVFFLVGGLLGPVTEELFFRGIVYGYLRRYGVILAVVGTTLIFVGAHSLRAGVPLPQIVGGVLFAVAYEVEGNLMVPIVIHVLGNLAIFGLCLLGGWL